MFCGGKIQQQQRWRQRRKASATAWDMIRMQRWAQLIKLLKDPKVELLYEQRRYIRIADSAYGNDSAAAKLPMLSYALFLGAPLVILQAFLDRFPAALHVVDSFGRLPLHLACIRQRSPSIIDLLLEEPSQDHSRLLWSVMLQDRKGNVPLHYAVQAACSITTTTPSSSSSSQQGIKPTTNFSLTTGTSATSITTTPYPSAVREEQDHLDVLTSLLAVCPQGAVIRNHQSETPIGLGRRLDRRSNKVVYNMLVRTSKTFHVHRNNSSSISHFHSLHSGNNHFPDESTTMPSSSHLGLEPSSVFLAHDETGGGLDWDGCERQAAGERPPRRNGICIRTITSR